MNITKDNYEECFLLYIDNELSASQRLQVEAFALRYPQLKDELLQLQEAILPQEDIICPDKNSLYKKERNFVPLHFVRLAAAAAVLGAVLMMYWWMTPSDNVTPSIVQYNIDTVEPQQMITPLQYEDPTVSQKDEQTTQTLATQTNNKKQNIFTTIDNEVRLQQCNSDPVIISHPTTSRFSNAGITIIPSIIMDTVALAINLWETINRNAPVKDSINTLVAKRDTLFFLDTDSEDNTVRIGLFDLNKNKINGLIRKTTRLLDIDLRHRTGDNN